MRQNPNRAIYIAGGICGILWAFSDLLFYAAYPIAAGGSILPTPAGLEGVLIRQAQLGQEPAVLCLEWFKVFSPLLLLPFLFAMHRFLVDKGQKNLSLFAFSLCAFSIAFSILAELTNPAINHELGQVYMDMESVPAREAMLGLSEVVFKWHAELNRVASLLYQGFVALFSLALLLIPTWKVRGWLGIAGALLALPAKIPLGIRVPTNFLWTGLAYFLWPIAIGIGLIKLGLTSTTDTGNNP